MWLRLRWLRQRLAEAETEKTPEDSIPPPMPWGLHHKALASLLFVGALSTGFAFMQ